MKKYPLFINFETMRLGLTLIFIHWMYTVTLFCQSKRHLHEIHCDTTHFYFESYKDSLDDYVFKMGLKKNLITNDERLKLAFYIALNRYPELHKTRITLRHKNINSTMQAQPSPEFIFKRKTKRAYKIFINNNPRRTGINYQELSFEGLVGWIGHEFAHLIDYNTMNNRALLGFIAGYIFDKKTMRRTERNADRETIKRGLGLQLLDGVAFFEKNNKISESYRNRKQKNYLSEAEIMLDIKRNCAP